MPAERPSRRGAHFRERPLGEHGQGPTPDLERRVADLLRMLGRYLRRPSIAPHTLLALEAELERALGLVRAQIARRKEAAQAEWEGEIL